MWQGHYYGNNYAGAKQDFAVRSGLIQRTQLFEQNELDELYRCCQRTRELDDTLTYQGEQQIIKTQEHIEAISPGVQERVAAMEMKQQEGQFNAEGYVAYHGTLSLDELMMEDPTEQSQGMQMGGLSC